MTAHRRHGRYAYRWLPLSVLVAAGVALLVGQATLRYVEARMVERTGQSVALAAVHIAEKLDMILQERVGDVQLLPKNPILWGRDGPAVGAFLQAVQDTYPTYLWLGVADPGGRILAATDPADIGRDEGRAPWFEALRRRDALYAQEERPSSDTGGMGAVALAVRLRDADGRFAGALKVLIGLPALEDAFAQTVNALQAQMGTAVRLEYQFLKQDGTVIVDAPLREEWEVNLQRAGLPSALRVGNAPAGYVEEEDWHGRNPVVTGYARTKWAAAHLGLDWGVLVHVERADVLAPIQTVERHLTLAGGLVLAPIMGLLVWSTGRLRNEWARVQERYRDLVHSLDAILWEGDPLSAHVAYISPQVERLLGYPPERWLSGAITWKDVIHPEDFPKVMVACKEAVVAGLNHEIEYRMRAVDGRDVWVKDLITVIVEQGRAVKLRGVIVDITAQKLAEQAERTNRAQTEAIINSAMDAIITIDESQRIVLFNGTAEQVFRCPASAALGQPIDRFIPERYRERHRAHVAEFGRTGRTSRVMGQLGIITGLRADGEEFPAESSVSKVEVEGRKQYTVILRDITKRVQADKSLRESEERFRRLVENLDQVFWFVSADGNEVYYVSPTYERIWGRTCASLYASPRSWIEAVHPEDRRTVAEAFERLAEEPDGGFDRIYRIVLPDGTVRTVHDRGFPVWEASGVVRGFAGLAEDITVREALERRKEAHYGLVRLLADAATLQEAGPHLLQTLCRAIGWEAGALWLVDQGTSIRCVEFWHRPDLSVAEFEAATRRTVLERGVGLPGRVWADGKPAWIPDLSRDRNLPRASAAKDAGLGRAIGVPISRDGEAAAVVEFFSGPGEEPDPDLLQFLSAAGTQIGSFLDRKLVESKAHVLLQAIEASAEALILSDLRDVIVYANPSAERMFGFEREDLVGRRLAELYPPEWLDDRFTAIFTAARQNGWSGEVVGLRKDGTRFPRWISLSPVRDRTGETQMLLCLSRDLTETKQMEAQAWRLERMATLGQLLGGIAHEMKNPLFIMTGRLQLLEDKLAQGDHSSVEDDLHKIEGAARRMTTVAERFLSLARPTPPHLEPCRVAVIVRDVLDFTANESMKNQIEVAADLSPALPTVWADSQQLHEVFLNLVLNAIQAMSMAHGKGRLTVSAASADGWIDVRIADDGPGIAPEHRAKLFEPFFSTKPPGKGTGLGLWAVRSILATVKGAVTFDSEPGRGTTFIVRLPAGGAGTPPPDQAAAG